MDVKKTIRFVSAFVLSLALCGTMTPAVISAEEGSEKTYTFDAKSLTAGSDKEKIDGSIKVGDENYFTLSDGFTKRTKSTTDLTVKSVETPKGTDKGISFTALHPASVSVSFSSTGGTNESRIALADTEGSTFVKAASMDAEVTEEADQVSVYKITGTKAANINYQVAAGSYMLVTPSDERGTRIYKISVTEAAGDALARKEWNQVSAPSLTLSQKNGSAALTAAVSAEIGMNGGDSADVILTDAAGKQTKQSFTSKVDQVDFKPAASGKYTGQVVLHRDGEEDKVSEPVQADFLLPLKAPSFKSITNKEDGKVMVRFFAVKEAESYELSVNGSVQKTFDGDQGGDTDTEKVYSTEVNLKAGEQAKFTVTARRGEDSAVSEEKEITVSNEAETEWAFTAYGSSIGDKKTDNFVKNADNSVTVFSEKGKGKLVPLSTDGLSFYYSEVPADQNFTLSADVSVDNWTLSNGQEGFGLMAADRVGSLYDGKAFWNNSYMASVTKVDYYYDKDTKKATDDTTKNHITMKLGIGSQEKTGVTKDNLSAFEATNTDVINQEFSTHMTPLETSCGEMSAGTYNIIGNSANTEAVNGGLTKFHFEIQKNNTGYFVTYKNPVTGESVTKKYYDPKALEKIDPDHVYAGFYASRNARATFSNISLTLIDPARDVPAEAHPVEYTTPAYQVVSAANANRPAYDVRYAANADGKVTITDEAGNKVADGAEVKAGAEEKYPAVLHVGKNTFHVSMTPDADYLINGDPYKKLSSYETKEFDFTVNYETINNGDVIYVSPEGKSTNDGTSRENPVDIYTAVKYVQAGQKILLAGGTYSLDHTLTADRGVDGTVDKPIVMTTENNERAVLNFNSKCPGVAFAGDYWQVSNIDVTKSGPAMHGLTLSGSHNVFENVNTYENGNTGFQISRYLTSDTFAQWPADNLVKNCTSYSNADPGYEDADGFAAKLTVGEGNVFDGCISYNNADDGWDFFAKVETGNIGSVTIQNCVAFDNGKGIDGTDEGNGNGFKMGGSSITGHHKLINSVAFNNKAKGIDCNSCPDIEVYHSTSYNNGSSNVALYTTDAKNTDFKADGVLSLPHGAAADNLKFKGSQDETKVRGSKNFYFDGKTSQNADGLQVRDDWFVSLNAPKADLNEPSAVAKNMRADNGSIDLGDFLKLTDTAKAAMKNAGLSEDEVSARLDGSQKVNTGIAAVSTQYALKENTERKVEAGKALTFEINADIDKFAGIMVDGNLLSADEYSLRSGSTIITLNPAYTRTLSAGKHALTALFKDGKFETVFTIEAKTAEEKASSTKKTETKKDVPDTYDGGALAWASICILSIAIAFVSIVLRKQHAE